MKLYHELSPPQLKARRTRWNKLTPEQQLAKWVEALRSGRYEKIENKLEIRVCASNCRCALGVLADISGNTMYTYPLSLGFLPRRGEVLAEPKFTPAVRMTPGTIIHLNDTERLTFEQIADEVEQAGPRK